MILPVPAMIIAALIAMAVAGVGGFRLGMEHVRAQLYTQQQAAEQARDDAQKNVNRWAEDFSRLRQESDENAAQLRLEAKNAKNRMAKCNRDRAELTVEFARLYDRAMQAGGGDRPEPPDAAAGAATVEPEAVIDNAIENGKRWKQCRDQLSSLIKAVKGEK